MSGMQILFHSYLSTINYICCAVEMLSDAPSITEYFKSSNFLFIDFLSSASEIMFKVKYKWICWTQRLEKEII